MATLIKEIKLIKSEVETNNNKWWTGMLYDDGTVKATWGRVGYAGDEGEWSGGQSYLDKKIKEKLKKGYTEVKTVGNVVAAKGSGDVVKNRDLHEIAKTQLVEFISSFKNKSGDEFQQWLVTRMDVELFLKTYAVNVICGMWDDYWGNSNNFYFYFDSAGKFYFIPYDYDNTLGTSLLIKDSGRQDVLNWGKSSNNLVKKIITIPEYLNLYKSYLKMLIDSKNDLFHVDVSKVRIQNWHKMIQNYISNDTGEDMVLKDVPADWGNCDFYRLLDSNNNFFVIRAANIPN